MQKVRYPNVTLSTMSQFEKDLAKWFHRPVPIWVTEYGHETRPAEPHGVTLAQQAAYAKQALNFAKKDPNIQMFVWFTFRDSAGNPWQSGLISQSGANKPAFASFGAVARLTDGSTSTVKAGAPVHVTMFVPYLAHYAEPGASIGMTYFAYNAQGKAIAVGQPTATLAPDQSVTFTPTFVPAKGQTYTVVATLNEANGHHQSRTAYITVS
jgi:hypothetical protein